MEGAAWVFHGSAGGSFRRCRIPGSRTRSSNRTRPARPYGFNAESGAGDVNGDGYDDVIIGGPRVSERLGWQMTVGAVYAYLGSARGHHQGLIARTRTLRLVMSESGLIPEIGHLWRATAGDVNGDGYDDVIVGAYWYDNGQYDEGRAFAYYGSASGLSTEVAWTFENNVTFFGCLGGSVGTAGDVNGDGYDDVIVGAPEYDGGLGNGDGAAFVFLGSAAGVADGDPLTANAQLEPNSFSVRLGVSVSGAGDVNGDGYDDVIVGDDDYDDFPVSDGGGFAFVFLGSATGVADGNPSTAHAQIGANQLGANLGWSVSDAGDVNADGYDDVIVGAWNYEGDRFDGGAAFVFLGSATGIASGHASTAHAQLESDRNTGDLGASVSSAGDVNGDGYDDVIVGADLADRPRPQ